jgi:choline dehydrogenase-like flavoprotein
MTATFDIVIIGSGAGGGTIARELAATGAKILIVERGGFIAQEDHNWNPSSVWGHRDVPAAAGGFQGDGALGRRVAGVAD